MARCKIMGCDSWVSCRQWCQRHYNLWYHLGVNPLLYEALMVMQDGKCGVCGKRPGPKSFAIDHDHETGAIRGLLCQRCNLYFVASNDATTIQKVAAYLTSPPIDTLPEEIFPERIRKPIFRNLKSSQDGR